jgi:hypothetical protein
MSMQDNLDDQMDAEIESLRTQLTNTQQQLEASYNANKEMAEKLATVEEEREIAATEMAKAIRAQRSTEKEFKDLKMNMRNPYYLFQVDDPCPKCGGLGRRAYPSTTGWRGGAGGSMITRDVCDVCWGSGDKNKKGTDLRRVQGLREAHDRLAKELADFKEGYRKACDREKKLVAELAVAVVMIEKDAQYSHWSSQAKEAFKLSVKWVKERFPATVALLEIAKTLCFYADPQTYFAIGILPDPPCGEFIHDCDDTGELGVKPGKRAREAIKAFNDAMGFGEFGSKKGGTGVQGAGPTEDHQGS